METIDKPFTNIKEVCDYFFPTGDHEIMVLDKEEVEIIERHRKSKRLEENIKGDQYVGGYERAK